MNTLLADIHATHVHFDNDTMWVDFADGRQLGIPLAYFPRLLRATPEERRKFTISGSGVGIHWDDLNEDISVHALLAGMGDRTRKVA